MTTSVNNNIKVELSYERYMKSYDVIVDYKGIGFGTLFRGDSGYIYDNDELIDRLKDNMKSFFSYHDKKVDVDKIEYVNTGKYLEIFIKGYEVKFN